MKQRSNPDSNYAQRLQSFLVKIHTVEQRQQKDLYNIMDTVPFRDLETALMMATLEDQGSYR